MLLAHVCVSATLAMDPTLTLISHMTAFWYACLIASAFDLVLFQGLVEKVPALSQFKWPLRGPPLSGPLLAAHASWSSATFVVGSAVTFRILELS
jgi:hypothetical protein